MKKERATRTILWRNVAIGSGILMIIAPLFGLLSTVFGMVVAFDTVGTEGGADPGKLAGDISRALTTTAGGLIISALSLIVFLVSLILMIRSRPGESDLPDS